jgi:Flp pilus assembly protein TadG
MTKRKGRKGITLVLAGLLAGVTLPLVGLAIDASLLYVVRTELSSAVDAAALAGARSLNRGMDLASQSASATATANAFFSANFPNGHLNATHVVFTPAVAESSYRTRTVTMTASADAPSYFMRLLGFGATTVRALGQASRRDVNLVLVLDRSGSMAAAMSDMTAAATAFVDRFAEGRDNVGLIVFSNSTVIAFPSPSPSGPESDFKSASPNVDTLIGETDNGGNTSTAQALWLAYQELVKRNEPGALNLIVFFTDGRPNTVIANFNDPTPSLNLLKSTSTCTYRLQANRPILGYISAYSQTGSTGTNYGVIRIDSDTVTSAASNPTAVQTNTNNCAFRSDITKMTRDVARIPPQDYYGNATTGYASVNLSQITSPAQLNNASLNSADSAVQRIRQDTNLNVVIYTLGYTGGSQPPDETWMKRISNDPTSVYYNPNYPTGLYAWSPTSSGLANAFAQVASEILRLSM